MKYRVAVVAFLLLSKSNDRHCLCGKLSLLFFRGEVRIAHHIIQMLSVDDKWNELKSILKSASKTISIRNPGKEQAIKTLERDC